MDDIRGALDEIGDKLDEVSEEIRSGLNEISEARAELKHILSYEKKHIPANLLEKFEEIFKNLDSGYESANEGLLGLEDNG